ncbi:MAG: hypothetical protein AB7N80_07760 [Bdellovibrionales bacterium]
MEYLNLENFLWLQAGLVVVGIAYLLRRGKRQGVQFRWRPRAERMIPTEMANAPRMWDNRVPQRHKPSSGVTDSPGPNGERALNVHFNFNGHSWDAFEVLGLPAGSSAEKVDDALRKVLSQSQNESHEFYKMAHDAIRKQNR